MSSVAGGHLSALDVCRHLAFLLAGRAAEEVIIGHPSSGAGGGPTSDLALATRFAVTAAAALGLDEVVGPLWLGDPDANDIERMLTNNPVVADQVTAALKVAYEHALARIRRRQAAVSALASLLIERRILDGAEVVALLDQDAAGRISTVVP